MHKNVAGQKVGAQMVNATTGAAFTGSVTVYVTGDAGTQALGSVASGVCTHEGNGFHTYAPAQAETNYDHIAFTFIGTGAIPMTVQVYPDLSDSALVSLIRQGLRAATLIVQSPVIGEKVTIYAEADYASDTTLLTFESDEWPDLSSSQYDDVQLHCRVDGTEMEVGTCTITQAGLPGTQIVTVALTNAETESLGVAVDPATPFRASLTSNYTLWAIKGGSPDKKWPLSNSTLSVQSTVWYEP